MSESVICPCCVTRVAKRLESERIICATVAEFYHQTEEDLYGPRRIQHLSFVRQVAMYLCRKLTKGSFPEIRALFGRDHSTVIHSYNLIGRRLELNGTPLRSEIAKIEVLIAERSASNSQITG